jgi:transcriptional regulator with XRE-family HTH domain
MGERLRQQRKPVKRNLSILPKESRTYSVVTMAKRSPAVDAIRERVKAKLAKEGHGARVAFGKKIGMKPSSVTAFLSGESNPTIDKIDAIARYLSCSVSDLFSAQSDNTPHHGASPVTPKGAYSGPIHSEGGIAYGIEGGLVQQLAELQIKHDRLRDKAIEFTNSVLISATHFGVMANEVKTLAEEKSAPGTDDRGHDRQLPRERHKRHRSQ